MYLEIPIKRGSCLLVNCFFFLFALTNFLVIVFHCKRKRPAVISFKMENRKERRTKDGFSKYCKVDTVQRHMADPRELRGTEGFLCLSLLGRLRRRSDKGCSGSLGARQCLQTRGGPCPLDVLFEERAATKEWWPLFTGGPFRSRRPDAWKARTRRATLPARAQRLGSKSQGHRPAHSRKRSWNMGWSWHYCSRVRLRKDSVSLPSALHIRYSSWWRGKCPSPLPPPFCSFCNKAADRAPERKLPAPGFGIRSGAFKRAAGGPPLPGSFLPALLWPEQERGTE